MKTFTTSDVRNRIGEFLDVGMVERVQLTRNNRVVGYFLPEREYNQLTALARTRSKPDLGANRVLSADQEEALSLYSHGKIGAPEVKSEIDCDARELLVLMEQRGLPLPRVSRDMAERMALEVLDVLRIPVVEQAVEKLGAPRG